MEHPKYSNLAVLAAFVAQSMLAWAQTAPVLDHFEVASIKAYEPPTTSDPIARQMASLPGMTGGPGTSSPERMVFSHMPLRILLFEAYGVHADQVSGPSWLDSEKFEINAKVAPEATRQQAMVMLQNLLIERFKITLHHAQEPNNKGYELTVAKSGTKLKAVEPDPKAEKPRPGEFFQMDLDADGFPVIPANRVGIVTTRPKGLNLNRMTCRGCSIPELIQRMNTDLAVPVGSPAIAVALPDIVDKTGLSGTYDFHFEYAGGPGAGGALRPPALDQPDSGPDLFTALEKQLGLKLQKVKMTHDVVVIDHIERVPTEN